MKKLISLTIASLFLFGCATTVIKTKPSGAKVYMDGKLLGETPCTYSNAGAVGSSKIVTLKMEGYKDNVGQIKKDHPSWPKIIAGAVVAWPLLIWAADFPPEYTFEMEKLESKLSDFPTKPQVTPPEKPITSAPVTPSLGTEKIVTWTFANIRSGAGDNYSIVTTVKQGDKLVVIGESGEWFNVRLENAQEGWISNKVVK